MTDANCERYCFSDSLDRKKVQGRVMLCRMGGGGVESTVKSYGGAGAIVVSDQYLDNAQIFMAPATTVNSSIGDAIYRYINSTRSLLIDLSLVYKERSLGLEQVCVCVLTFDADHHRL